MAIKGLVDTQAYVIGDYHTPVGYFNPARSVGDYVVDDYVITDYLFEALDLQSTFTIQAEGQVNAIRANLISVFTLQADAEDLDLATGTLSGAFTISVTTTRLRTGTATMAVSGTLTAQANAQYKASKTLDTTSTVSAQANYTAASESISIIGFYTQTQVAGELFFGEPQDVTWDSFRESEFIDRSWDEWYGDQWDQGGVIYSVASILQAKGGYRAIGSATLSAAFTQQQNITIAVSKTITAENTLSGTAVYIAGGFASPTAQATAQADPDRFRGVAIDGTPLDIPAVLTLQGNAIARFDLGYVQDIQPQATVQTQANVVFDLAYGQSIGAAFAQSTDANALFSPSLGLSAFNTQLSAGRIITIADPWNILTVPLETRTLVIPEDSRVIKVLQESRLNTVIAETRGLRVPQETRKYKIFKPVFTNRSSLPKVRSET